MDRLTKRTASGIDALGAVITKSSRGWVYKIADRLAAYEDTGLTPERIVELNTFEGSQLEKLLLAENGRLRAELAALKAAQAWKGEAK